MQRSLCFAVALLLSGIAGGEEKSDPIPNELIVAAEEFERAQIDGDRAALERLLADDYVLANSAGQLETRQELIAYWTEPGVRHEPVTVREPVQRVWTDGAALGGLVTLRGVRNGQSFAVTLRYVDVWSRRAGRWQVVYGQAGVVRTAD